MSITESQWREMAERLGSALHERSSCSALNYDPLAHTVCDGCKALYDLQELRSLELAASRGEKKEERKEPPFDWRCTQCGSEWQNPIDPRSQKPSPCPACGDVRAEITGG